MAEELLKATGLYHVFESQAEEGNVVALRGLSVALRDGVAVAVVGPSGAGKSTLLKALGGLLKPSAGVVQLAGEDITIYGDGTQTRSVCYVNDLVDGIYKLMQSDYGEPVNIGNPTEMNILDLAEKIIQITESSSQVIHTDEMLDDPKVRQPDITLARKLLGWEPEVTPDQGLRLTVEWFQNN